jgi:hypothetical protein
MRLVLAGEVTSAPDDHTAQFAGEHPCDSNGVPIEKIRHNSGTRELAPGVVVQHSFSAKPQPKGKYPDYYEKVTTYVSILSGPAQHLDANVSAKTFPLIVPELDGGDPFHYTDTASSRAEIVPVSQKLRLGQVAIVGLGGTGSYVLDLLAKTLVAQIHLFDGDLFLQHNAFRSPGAPSIDDLKVKHPKAVYFKDQYSKMHRGIVAHPYYLGASNADELKGMDFVFLCLDKGAAKKVLVESLEAYEIPFIDVGMGVQLTDNALGGMVRVTTSTPQMRDHVRNRVSFGDGAKENEYGTNIQIADLNSLNASLAVIRWKKLFGFYRDVKAEHNSLYTTDGGLLLHEDRQA